MHKGAPADNFKRAEDLRLKMTAAENLLWARIKDKQLYEKFRRQHPIQLYIVDFYCHKHKLVIEVDGKYHDSRDQILKDEERSSELKFMGLEIMRFKNDEILNDIEMVIKDIKGKIETLNTDKSK